MVSLFSLKQLATTENQWIGIGDVGGKGIAIVQGEQTEK